MTAQLTMPPAMVLFIRVLQASRSELHLILEERCASNPLLDRSVPQVAPTPDEAASAPEVLVTGATDAWVVSYDDLGLETLRVDEARL